jgi:alpha-beta hydrolase superfamily lysophospholipase
VSLSQRCPGRETSGWRGDVRRRHSTDDWWRHSTDDWWRHPSPRPVHFPHDERGGAQPGEPASRAFVIAHSMGVLVARPVAETWPQGAGRLVLIGSAFPPPDQDMCELREAVWQLPDRVPESFVRELQGSTLHAPVPKPFFESVVAARG